MKCANPESFAIEFFEFWDEIGDNVAIMYQIPPAVGGIHMNLRHFFENYLQTIPG